MKRIPALDGLRGVAILLVVVFHTWPRFMPAGGYGVTVFFVLSGFLITGILVRDAGHDGFQFKRFYWNRAVRLLPALALMLIAYGIYYGHWGSIAWTAGYAANIGQILGGNLQHLSHTWSLAVEEHFYLIWPLLLWLIKPAWRLRATAALFGVAVAWRIVMTLTAEFERVRVGTDTAAFALLAGCLLAILHDEGRLLVPSESVTTVAVLILGFAAFVAGNTSSFLWGELPVVCLSMIAVAGSLGRVRILEGRAIGWFGLVSYGLYLWHLPVLWTDLAPKPLLLLGAVAITAGSYYLVELPLRHRFHIGTRHDAPSPASRRLDESGGFAEADPQPMPSVG